ncbi:hypothetical protein I6I18_04435 [Kytococcus sedentarius]|uniref:hypothetical protein n=1 Tax=Kytococcus sedentarius TaxID=1276 RepID=UPI00117C61F0|nr:hypothetical protein [Kytococcus sedentarius]QQB64686.1 hypothetical protein I6I18_04435 [Kytococcus sedentarius]
MLSMLSSGFLAAGLLAGPMTSPPSASSVSVEQSAPLAAATQSDGSAPTSATDSAAADAADAATIAEQEGRSVASVKADLEWQKSVQAEIDKLAARDPQAFTGSTLSVPDRSVWVGFTGAAPTGPAQFPTGTTAKLQGGLPLNHEARVQAARDGAEVVEQQFGAETVARVDAISGRTEVFVAAAAPSDASAKTRRVKSQVDGQITVHFDPDAKGGEESINGGGRLEWSGSNTLKCTSAFTQERSLFTFLNRVTKNWNAYVLVG